MKTLILITTYNRPEPLLNLLALLNADKLKQNLHLHIYNDGSDRDYTEVLCYIKKHFSYDYFQIKENGGKENYWQLIHSAYQNLKNCCFDYFIQLPDDIGLVDNFLTKALDAFANIQDKNKVSLNIWNDYSRFGKALWTPVKTTAVKFGQLAYHKIGWVDMCFVANKRFFEVIDYSVHKPGKMYLENKELSSGVGAQLSKALVTKNSGMYQVIKSLVIHNDHASVMHPQHRLKTPLITNHEKVTASLASIPGRTRSLKDTISSIIHQVDELHVYLNEFKCTPDFLKHPKITYFHSKNEIGDIGDAGKFYQAHKIKGYHLTIDDDLIYPADYVKTLVHAMERNGRKYLLSFHGRSFSKKPVQSYYRDALVQISCLKSFPEDVFVDVPGTGVMAYHSDTINFSIEDFKASNMADIWAGKKAKESGVKILALKHLKGWIKHTTKIDRKDTIFHHLSDRDGYQTQIINSFI